MITSVETNVQKFIEKFETYFSRVYTPPQEAMAISCEPTFYVPHQQPHDHVVYPILTSSLPYPYALPYFY